MVCSLEYPSCVNVLMRKIRSTVNYHITERIGDIPFFALIRDFAPVKEFLHSEMMKKLKIYLPTARV